ncbi:GFA family protein [Sphingomonas psychrotolerans]|uniref:CENP-V/GFA domain-containing protein n=1 Tax=Sphingomonas psychrotolerans TaxID=1327635 RepID=A0A2K8MIE9_9SPHN|nr:GFA family protein [Sphingomonas psychrotolerans]ATY33662.1 hypothetical protein CVN68_18260 [Sphingomonas psychrotolerans]
MESTDGGCHCGAVRYRVSGEPAATTHCHCADCRRITGGPTLAWAIFPEDKVEILAGEVAVYESSPGVEWGFCARCGSTLTYRRASRPGLFDVTTATLDDPEIFPPEKEIWTGERLSWIRSNPDVPHFARAAGG